MVSNDPKEIFDFFFEICEGFGIFCLSCVIDLDVIAPNRATTKFNRVKYFRSVLRQGDS